MPNEYTVQTSYHFGRPDFRGLPQDLLNVRADNPDDLAQILDAVEVLIPRIVGLSETIAAVDNLSKGGLEPANADSKTGPAPYPQQPLMQPPATTMSCMHGTRIFRTGVGARGNWSGHFCPLPKGDPNACKPVWGN